MNSVLKNRGVSHLHDMEIRPQSGGEMERPACDFFPVPLLLALALLLHGVPAVAEESVPAGSVVRVNVTTQAYDFLRPWSKQAPQSRRAIGAVIPGPRVLVSAELVANHTFVEIEDPETTARVPATVTIADHSANLAIIEPVDPSFLDNFRPMGLAENVEIGERLRVLQLEASGTLLSTDALVTSVQVAAYPMGDSAMLMYSLTSALQGRDGSFIVPLVQGDNLAGIVIRHDTRTQNMSAIPIEVVRHFLANVDSGEYTGFPRAGITYTSTRDPQFRQYIGLNGHRGGVYVVDVTIGGAGDQAGIQAGDILLEVGGRRVDQDGNYQDPVYGRLAMANLTSLSASVGETIEMVILRDGVEKTIPVVLRAMPASEFVSPPFIVDEPPRFLVVGGLVFQELSRQYLRSFGGSWEERASSKLVYYDRFQATLFPERDRRIVFMSGVLPTPSTVGFGELGQLVLESVNGRGIRRLEDLQSALENPPNGFHEFRFEDDPRLFYLDAGETEAMDRAVLSVYGLPSLKQF